MKKQCPYFCTRFQYKGKLTKNNNWLNNLNVHFAFILEKHYGNLKLSDHQPQSIFFFTFHHKSVLYSLGMKL